MLGDRSFTLAQQALVRSPVVVATAPESQGALRARSTPACPPRATTGLAYSTRFVEVDVADWTPRLEQSEHHVPFTWRVRARIRQPIATHSACVTSCCCMTRNRVNVTGTSSSLRRARPCSVSSDPIVKLPAGIRHQPSPRLPSRPPLPCINGGRPEQARWCWPSVLTTRVCAKMMSKLTAIILRLIKLFSRMPGPPSKRTCVPAQNDVRSDLSREGIIRLRVRAPTSGRFWCTSRRGMSSPGARTNRTLDGARQIRHHASPEDVRHRRLRISQRREAVTTAGDRRCTTRRHFEHVVEGPPICRPSAQRGRRTRSGLRCPCWPGEVPGDGVQRRLVIAGPPPWLRSLSGGDSSPRRLPSSCPRSRPYSHSASIRRRNPVARIDARRPPARTVEALVDSPLIVAATGSRKRRARSTPASLPRDRRLAYSTAS